MWKLASVILLCKIMVAANPASAQQTLNLNTGGGPPFHTVEQTGFVDIVLQQAFRRIGVGVKITILPAERAMLNANAGIDDGETDRIAGLEKLYPNLMAIPEPVSNWKFVAFAKQVKFPTAGWDSLRPYSVGYINGAKIFEQNTPKTVHLTKVGSVAQLFKVLLHGRAQIVLFEAWQGLAYRRRQAADIQVGQVLIRFIIRDEPVTLIEQCDGVGQGLDRA